jgi:hypothetical protein
MKWTFFTGSAIGYVGHPQALFTRTLADGLAGRGDIVRLVEPRRNEHFERTLECERAPAASAMYELFPAVQHHTFEMRRGPRLFEWLAREIALIDVAVAVHGADTELVRWLANLNQPDLLRLFQTYQPEELTTEVRAELELDLFNGVLAASAPADDTMPWQLVQPSIADADMSAGRMQFVDELSRTRLVHPATALADLDRAVAAIATSISHLLL